MDLKKLKFPIGNYEKPEHFTPQILAIYMDDIENFPGRLRKEVGHLSDEQLDTQYRPEGWTIRQVVNHCADSHANAIIRFKLALTENSPIIKPYMEHLWAELADGNNIPVEPALMMLEGIHTRWGVLLRSLNEMEFNKCFVHPEHGREIFLNESMGMYAWHCNHHLAHITTLKERKNWE